MMGPGVNRSPSRRCGVVAHEETGSASGYVCADPVRVSALAVGLYP
jgi:hypothetical protein